MSHEHDNLVLEPSGLEALIIPLKTMVKMNNKAIVGEANQLQSMKEHINIVDEWGHEFMREMYTHLEGHNQEFKEQKETQKAIKSDQREMINIGRP